MWDRIPFSGSTLTRTFIFLTQHSTIVVVNIGEDDRSGLP